MKRILSIDWDYFQNVSTDILKNYPDGIDRSTELSELIWGIRYAQCDFAKEVAILENEYNLLIQLLLMQNKNCPVMIANSHKHIYRFITERCNGDIELINIDMHHDILNDNPELDCGNWIGSLLKENRLKNFRWVYNPVSLKMYGIEDGSSDEDKTLRKIVQKIGLSSISDIQDKSFDMIFLARSDIWSPPHLDKYFSELVSLMCAHFKEVIAEQGIEIPRKEYLEVAVKVE